MFSLHCTSSLKKKKKIDFSRFLESTHFIWLVTKTVPFFFNSDEYKKHKLWSCQNVWAALVYLLDNILLDLELNFIDKLQVFR